MRKLALIVVFILLAVALSFTAALAQDIGEISVTCPGGLSFTNGIEFQVVQMRAGYDYTATVIGLNGFDPILAVLDENLEGGICSDDDRKAAEYGADLPSTGEVEPSSTSAQVIFNHNDRSGFQTISLVVGGYGDQHGEFLLILEGMATTTTDNAGDAYSVRVTPSMVESETPIIVYALQAFNSQSDPILSRIDGDFNVVEDSNGRPMTCDDAGTDSCWAEGPTLEDYYVSITDDVLPGGALDAAMVQDTSTLELTDDPEMNFINFLVNSYEGSEGQYVMVFHVGSAEATRGGK